MRDEELHALVARSTCPGQNVQYTHTHTAQTTFGSWDVEKVHPVVARSRFGSQNFKNTPCSDHFWTIRCHFVCQGQRIAHLVKSVQNVKVFVAFLKTMAGVGHLKGIWKDDRRSGRWFLQRGCILEHQVFRFAEMILRDMWITSYDLTSLFRGKRATLEIRRIEWKNRKKVLARGRQLSTQLSIFEGHLAELLCFGSCQVQKLRKSRSIASFLMLSGSRIEEVGRNCFGFKLSQKTDQ